MALGGQVRIVSYMRGLKPALGLGGSCYRQSQVSQKPRNCFLGTYRGQGMTLGDQVSKKMMDESNEHWLIYVERRALGAGVNPARGGLWRTVF